ncbi:MAG: winged helix-turn-helix transcriptional regulator [Clostridia bacterium]|jgi:DNA-binding MarR family transcriptional regulator|nr:winged helix-turn-helix transcriptional regulator [Clostridia bacterium]
MKRASNLIEIESLLENLMKKKNVGGILRMKILFFSRLYENLSISMIIEKLGIQKTNFALMTAALEKEGCIVVKKSNLDRRCRVVELTEKGNNELDGYLKELDRALDATSPEIDYAIEILSKYLNKII